MLRSVKQIVWLTGLIIGCQSAFGFALIGPSPSTANPADAFETADIGYNPGGGELGVPKDIKEEYRRNTPVMYYSFDESFYDYFGTNGASEIDKAMAMYNSIGDVSQYSSDLSEFPTDSRRMNFRAGADGLLDLKSEIMGLMTQELGFFEPSRWVWCLHARIHLTGAPPCPAGMEYAIIKRNFDYVPHGSDDYPSTSYVNGVLYSYVITEICQGGLPLADAVEFPVDPLASPYSAVADFASLDYVGLLPGAFYTSLTRDDVGALRYLDNTNNFNIEAAGLRTTEFITNDAPAAIQTFDLSLFSAQALTNSGAALSALYPGLVVLSDTNFLGVTITTNITETLVNSPFDPAGLLPSHPVITTNYTTNFFNYFGHTFGNVVTNTSASMGLVGTINLALVNPQPYAPAGTVPTVTSNFVVAPQFVPGAFGDFFILPTNLCGAQILSNLTTTVTATTNLPQLISTVAPGSTNPAITFIPGNVSFFTNHTAVYLPVTCPLDSVGRRGGPGKLIFVRRDYDSIVGQVWDPVTNDYTVQEWNDTNNVPVTRHMQRRVPRPDFLFTCADMAANNTFIYSNTVDNLTETLTVTITGLGEILDLTTNSYNSPNAPNLAGPGTIVGPAALPGLIILNKAAPLYENTFPGDETSQLFVTGWASFDGTTNAPVLYPNGESLDEFENLLASPAPATPYLPNANVNLDYSAQLSAKGEHPPFTWSLAPGSAGLPDGLTLTPNGRISGNPSGPASIYDFTLRITDSVGAFRDVQYTITIF